MSFLTESEIINIPTKDQQLKNVCKRIKNLSKQTFNNLVEVQKQGINEVWNHPKLTPQEIIDELGESAIKIFQFHGALTDYINTLATTEGITVDLKYPTKAFTVNATGEITVTNDPYVV